MSNLEKAIATAVEAHLGQVDKGGNPYILHPLRVMMSLKTEKERIVGVLHDVIEDCSDKGFDLKYLREQGFDEQIIEAIRSITKTPEEEKLLKSLAGEERVKAYLSVISRAKANPIGRRVKQADIRDNMDIGRIPVLSPRDLERLNQYKEALAFLE
jgi:(p)ppGpp synthase/HD superfamily hydrolase